MAVHPRLPWLRPVPVTCTPSAEEYQWLPVRPQFALLWDSTLAADTSGVEVR
jgi:hypothetical protein